MMMDCEKWKEDIDTVINIMVPENEPDTKYTLDKNGTLIGQNSIRVDYNLNVPPTYSNLVLLPDDDKCSPSKMAGLKFTARSDTPILLTVIPSCDYEGMNAYVEIGPEAKEYTIRWEDFTPVKEGLRSYESAYMVTSVVFAVLNNDILAPRGQSQPQGFNNKSSFWIDDVYFYVGDGRTNLDGVKVETGVVSPVGNDSSDTSDTVPQVSSDAPDGNSNGSPLLWVICGVLAVLVIGAGVALVIALKKRKQEPKNEVDDKE